MSEHAYNGDTIALLKECDAGTKMATDSMEQIKDFISNPQLTKIISKYNKAHIEIGEEVHMLLNDAGEAEKDPNPVAKAMSWMSSQIKMMVKGDASQASNILIDGCNMGIKSLNEYKNKYTCANEESVSLCDKLIGLEKDFMADLEQFL